MPMDEEAEEDKGEGEGEGEEGGHIILVSRV